MKIDFRIDWGYQYLYSRRHYHPTYLWNGKLLCSHGRITEIYQLSYPVIWYGPGHCAKETPLLEPKWNNQTKRGLSGIRVVAETHADAEFELITCSGNFCIKVRDIIEKGRIEFPVGPKYLGCFVTVTKTDYFWFRTKAPDGTSIINYDQLNLPVHHHARMPLAWLGAGETVTWTAEIPPSDADFTETLFHLEAMSAPWYSKEKEGQIDTYVPMEILCDGKSVLTCKHYFRKHDFVLQILDDVWQRATIPPGKHTFALKNHHPNAYLLISRILMSQSKRNHGQLSIPSWAVLGEKIIGKVFAAKKDVISVDTPTETLYLSCNIGWNEFEIFTEEAGIWTYKTKNSSADIEVYPCKEETYPIKIGCDLTQIVHDDSGELDWLLDYIQRTRLGNYVLVRNFLASEPNDQLLYQWGSYCKKHNIYVGACTSYLSGSLIKGAGDHFNDCGRHEYPGSVYAADPAPPYISEDMKQASERFIEYLKIEVDKYHKIAKTAAFGDASGGTRYAFLAGADFIRAETMAGPTMPLLSQTRAASEALSKGRWGVHIAIQHSYQPYHLTHLRQYFLSLMQPWMMGAEVIYEEDSLFGMWSEERQCWSDLLVKGKRDMTRRFYRFAKTHPRNGKNVRRIAFIEGRYAAPFNGFICDSEQDPHYSVWGLFGNPAPEWGHGQPEKCHQLLDVLMPGTSTHPLRQQFDKRRFFFSGTPYGDFDCVPIEASQEYINHYRLLLNLGWNTMIASDYEKLGQYVENGGILLTGLLQFSKHTKREFLKNMDELNLWNNGDLTSLCGFKANGPSTTYSGQWNCADRENMPIPALSSAPSDSITEDGPARLADITLTSAEIVAWDSATGAPLLVRNRYGRGYVYTFTIWAYPGHEAFQDFCAAWIEKLSADSLSDCYVQDPSKEVFWTRWVDGNRTTLMLLNTDWTQAGNEKTVSVICGTDRHTVPVKEGIATMVNIVDHEMTVVNYDLEAQ